jgi:hypothetical protein
MAPIICQVFDSNRLGIKGIKVSLQCFIIPGKPEAQYLSYTGEDGNINMWFCQDKDDDDKPQLVEALDYTYFRITFYTKSFFRTGALL